MDLPGLRPRALFELIMLLQNSVVGTRRRNEFACTD
jgi:hypothetical protein